MIDKRENGSNITSELRGSKGRKGMSMEHVVPQLVLHLAESLTPNPAVASGRHSFDQEFEVASQDQ
jgi:hypothetical protein